MLRACTRQRLAAVPTSSLAVQRRGRADAKASFDSPFKNNETTKIPNFGNYKSKSSETSNRVFGYLMAGTMGGLSAMGAKATVQGEFGGQLKDPEGSNAQKPLRISK